MSDRSHIPASPAPTGASFAAAVYAFAVIMLGTTLPTPLYAIYGEELGFGVTTTTVIFAVYAAGVIAALIGFGRWSDVIGRRKMLIAGAPSGSQGTGKALSPSPRHDIARLDAQLR